MNNASITQSELKDVLHYAPDTGIFTWIQRGPGRPLSGQAGCVSQGYRNIRVNKQTYRAHRLAWLYIYGEWPENDIDHINGHGIDNRIDNLRDVSKALNQRNAKRRYNNKSGITGVHWHKAAGKWSAQITVAGKRVYLGSLASIYRAASVRHFAMEIEGGYTKRHGV